jgi:CRP-like cAMP-binding protein
VAKASSRASVKRQPISSNHKGQPIHNEILRSLPRKEFDTVFAALEFVDLPVRTILNDPGEAITSCYFVNSGLVSILSVLSEGKSVEVGLTGKEGFVGLPLVVGLKTSGARAIVQIPASAFRINAAKMVAVLRRCPSLESKLNRYAHALGAQSVQVAACNRLHEVDQRLARWLLMCQDRVGGDDVLLTQEFLGHMLGTRRASVTVAAGMLQKAGYITYNRGKVRIVNRDSLKSASCECYAALITQINNWQSEVR